MGLGAALLGTVGCVGPRSELPAIARDQIEAAENEVILRRYEQQMAEADRLHRVSWRILRVIAETVPESRTRPMAGVRWIDLNALDDRARELVRGHFELPEGLVIASVAPDSPAETAGLQPNDRVIGLAGESPIDRADAAAFLQRRVSAALRREGSVVLTVEREGEPLDIRLTAVPVADFPIRVHPRPHINARAYGRRIEINEGMLRFVQNDAELAFIIAHEAAHNALRHHRAVAWNYLVGTLGDVALAALGIVTPNLVGLSSATARSKDFEREADLLALQWMREAGYDIADALDLWPRLGARAQPKPRTRRLVGTHPPLAERIALMRLMAEPSVGETGREP